MERERLVEKAELVVNKLMNLGKADEEMDKKTSKESHKKGLIARDFGIQEWDWPQGVGLYGLLKLQKFYGDQRYDEFLKKWYEDNRKIGLPSSNINTTTPFLTLVDLISRVDEPAYENMCTERAEWLMHELPKTKDGGFQHVTTAIGNRYGVHLNDGEIWADTMFMAVLFLSKMGVRYDRQDYIDEAVKQMLIHIKYLYEKKNGLFYHGWSFNLNSNFGGIFWCRGNCWFTVAASDFLETVGDRISSGVRAYIEDTLRMQIGTLAKLQAPSGLWHTVLDDESSYEEVSGSSGFTAGILKAIKLGIVDDSYLPCAKKALAAICDNVAEDGTVLNVSAGTGMGDNAEHYKNIMIAPMAYGQSLALIALCEGMEI